MQLEIGRFLNMNFTCCPAINFVVLCLLFAGCIKSHDTQEEPASETENLKLKGHLQAFGESGTRLEVDVTDRFLPPKQFFEKYVQPAIPVKFSGVARDTRAYHWTDEYLLSLEIPHGKASHVNLETMKKEERNQQMFDMNFHDFLKIYNDSELYMVDNVPAFLRADVLVPCSLQCPELLNDRIEFANMWFSSGGTKSVVHTDSFDNINCLFRGEKTFIMVDPAVHGDKIDLESVGAYFAGIDVDSVDLIKHPKLCEVEFYHVNMTAGDCLFIPNRWIHQVRSYHSNVAVNFWWKHYAALQLLDKGVTCPDKCDHQLTLQNFILGGDEDLSEPEETRDWLMGLVTSKPLSRPAFFKIFADDARVEVDDLPDAAVSIISGIFEQVDADKDGWFSLQDTKQQPPEVWQQLSSDLTVVIGMFDEMYGLPGQVRESEKKYVYQDRRDEL